MDGVFVLRIVTERRITIFAGFLSPQRTENSMPFPVKGADPRTGKTGEDKIINTPWVGKEEWKIAEQEFFSVVREGGLEPPRRWHEILSLACLPVPPPSLQTDAKIVSVLPEAVNRRPSRRIEAYAKFKEAIDGVVKMLSLMPADRSDLFQRISRIVRMASL